MHFSLGRNFDLPYRIPPGKSRGSVFKEVRIEGIDTSPWEKSVQAHTIARCLFPTYVERLPQNVTLLEISVPVEEDIQELSGDLNGIPVHKRGAWLRMVYLSASTITTVGFGDIVPLTSWARGFVTAEPICGVVFAGLFLNAIARRGTDR
jgi:hypothetical protein